MSSSSSIVEGLRRTRLGNLKYSKNDLSNEESYKIFIINKCTPAESSAFSAYFTEDEKFFEKNRHVPMTYSGLSPDHQQDISSEFNEDDLRQDFFRQIVHEQISLIISSPPQKVENKRSLPLIDRNSLKIFSTEVETKNAQYENELIFWTSKVEEDLQTTRDISIRNFTNQHDQHWKKFSPKLQIPLKEDEAATGLSSWKSVEEKISKDLEEKFTEQPELDNVSSSSNSEETAESSSQRDEVDSSASSIQLSNGKESSRNSSTEATDNLLEDTKVVPSYSGNLLPPVELPDSLLEENVKSDVPDLSPQVDNLNDDDFHAKFDIVCNSIEEKLKIFKQFQLQNSTNISMAKMLKQAIDISAMVNSKYSILCDAVTKNGAKQSYLKIATKLEQILQEATEALLKVDLNEEEPNVGNLDEEKDVEYVPEKFVEKPTVDNVQRDKSVTKMEAEQTVVSGDSDSQNLPNSLKGRILFETYEFYKSLQHQVDTYENSLKSFKENDTQKKYRNLLTVRSKTLFNLISSDNFKKSLPDLIYFLKGKDPDVKVQHEITQLFCFFTISDAIVKRIEMESSKIQTGLFVVASVACWLSSTFEPFKSILLDRIYRRCPWLIPFDKPQGGLSEEEHMKTIGYEIDENGNREDRLVFIKRIESKARFLAALSITFPPTHSQQRTGLFQRTQPPAPKNPFGLKFCWNLIANICNLPPVDRITSLILYEVLQIAGFYMKQNYKDQFVRLIVYLEKVYLPKLQTLTDDSKFGGHYRLLELLLREKNFKIPEGYTSGSNLVLG